MTDHADRLTLEVVEVRDRDVVGQSDAVICDGLFCAVAACQRGRDGGHLRIGRHGGVADAGDAGQSQSRTVVYGIDTIRALLQDEDIPAGLRIAPGGAVIDTEVGIVEVFRRGLNLLDNDRAIREYDVRSIGKQRVRRGVGAGGDKVAAVHPGDVFACVIPGSGLRGDIPCTVRDSGRSTSRGFGGIVAGEPFHGEDCTGEGLGVAACLIGFVDDQRRGIAPRCVADRELLPLRGSDRDCRHGVRRHDIAGAGGDLTNPILPARFEPDIRGVSVRANGQHRLIAGGHVAAGIHDIEADPMCGRIGRGVGRIVVHRKLRPGEVIAAIAADPVRVAAGRLLADADRDILIVRDLSGVHYVRHPGYRGRAGRKREYGICGLVSGRRADLLDVVFVACRAVCGSCREPF